MLSSLEKRIAVAVVVTALLLVAGGVAAFLNRDRIEAWLTGDEVVAAQRSATTAELPVGLEDDPTRSACGSWTAVRCAWSDGSPEEAARLMVGVLGDAGLDTGDVACGDHPEIPDSVAAAGDAVCVAQVPVAGEHLWVVTTDRTPVGHVPLGRTAAWAVWDESAMSLPMLELLQPDWVSDLPETYETPPAEEIAAVLPDRFVPLLDGPCRSESADRCSNWEGPVDLADLGDDPVPALVIEFTDAGYFVVAADLDWTPDGVRAHRWLQAPPSGVSVAVRVQDGVLVGQVFSY